MHHFRMTHRALTIVCVVLVCLVGFVHAAPFSSGSVDTAPPGDFQHFTWMIVYAAVALVCSFLCSVAEAVVLSITPAYIWNLDATGSKSGKLLKNIKQNIDRSLAAILTLNTIAHTIGAAGAGAEAAAFFGAKLAGVAMVVLTLLILFLSEIIPKTLGALWWRQLAPWTARFVQSLIWTLFPLILVSELITKLITRDHPVHVFSRDEFAAMADVGAASGELDVKESRILKNLFRFPDLCARDIMTPRTVVFALQQDLTVNEVLEQHKEISFSRIPIFRNDRDDITGFVLKTELLLNQQNHEGRAKLRDLKREIRVLDGATPLSHVLEELLDHRAHLLLAIDPYGGMEGLVTLEDVVETLIGIEIVDEVDKIDDMRKLARQKWEQRMNRIGIHVDNSSHSVPSPESPP